LTLRISAFGKSDVGLVRKGNEDNFRIINDKNLFIVCDGMGGHQAGEVASKEACDIIDYSFLTLESSLAADTELTLSAKFPPGGDLLVKAIRLANRGIYFRSRSRSDLNGMGTTVVALQIEKNIINIAHVGDSRAYRLTETGLVPLTTDHSWISELRQSGQYSEAEAAQIVGKNIITRALGVNERVEIDYRADIINPGDIFLLCTDGLCGYADDNDIFGVAKDCGNDLELIVENLIQLANDRGGQDNVTVIAVRIDETNGEDNLQSVKPVTVSVESEQALIRENQLIDYLITSAEKTVKISEEPEVKTGGRFPLIFIFAVFFVVAILIIYLSLGRQ
jgi:protein phosphatase